MGAIVKLIELLATIALKLTEISFRVLGEILKAAFALMGSTLASRPARQEGRVTPRPIHVHRKRKRR